MNRFKIFLQLTFLRMRMITGRDLVHLFLYMKWFSMLLQIDLFRKIIVTIFTFFVTSCNKFGFNAKMTCLSKLQDQINVKKKSWTAPFSRIMGFLAFSQINRWLPISTETTLIEFENEERAVEFWSQTLEDYWLWPVDYLLPKASGSACKNYIISMTIT